MTNFLQVADYWNTHIHDLSVASHPIGSRQFFEQLSAYRFNKLRYLPHLVKFNEYAGQRILEIGCGLGIDLAQFAEGGAHVTGIDLSQKCIDLAQQHFEHRGLSGEFYVMDGGDTPFETASFDMIYVHGVLQYAPNPQEIITESHRVLKPTGQLIAMVYNRHSWLPIISKLTNTPLEHTDAPVYKMYTQAELEALLAPFSTIDIIPERFPVPTELHTGIKATVYNKIFVGGFNALPKTLTRQYGWHLMAFATE